MITTLRAVFSAGLTDKELGIPCARYTTQSVSNVFAVDANLAELFETRRGAARGGCKCALEYTSTQTGTSQCNPIRGNRLGTATVRQWFGWKRAVWTLTCRPRLGRIHRTSVELHPRVDCIEDGIVENVRQMPCMCCAG